MDRVSFYHCICRCVELQAHLKRDQVKNVLQEMIWRAADFSGVQVITYCIMDDHFHLLVRVPPKKAEITDEELLRRYRSLYHSTPGAVLEFTQKLKERSIRRDLKVDRDQDIETIINNLKTRMHDVSEFMKTLKQRFTQWFNRTNERVGTLWTERFKSLIVENNPHLLANIAAYIEMNPVRAGLCDKAQDHKWCGIRDFLERNGIYSTLQVIAGNTHEAEGSDHQSFEKDDTLQSVESVQKACMTYGYWFYRDSILPLVEEIQTEFTEEKQRELESAKTKLNTNRKEVLESMNLPMRTLLKGRLRHLSEGMAIGSILFLQVIASLANGSNHGRSVPLNTGFQVDEELRLMCLRRIRGPKIE